MKTKKQIKNDESSKFMRLNKTDYKKIAKGAALAFGAAALVSISTWLSQGEVNWNLFLTVCIPAALSTGINAGMKFFQGQK
jgi:uncharacterized membrane protein YfcA